MLMAGAGRASRPMPCLGPSLEDDGRMSSGISLAESSSVASDVEERRTNDLAGILALYVALQRKVKGKKLMKVPILH